MAQSSKFWIQLALFQVIFGVAVFAATRYYYLNEAARVGLPAAILNQPMASWPAISTGTETVAGGSVLSDLPASDDPAEISRLANEAYASKNYATAAQLYERLLPFAPTNVDTYNNLGLTLFYLGNSTEALRRLNEGVAVNPKHQRIWLTLGFVNGQLGDLVQARIALTNAVELGADTPVGQSAASMLENLP